MSFLIFAFAHYYPRGGIADLIGTVAEEQQIIPFLADYDLSESENVHVYDTDAHRVTSAWRCVEDTYIPLYFEPPFPEADSRLPAITFEFVDSVARWYQVEDLADLMAYWPITTGDNQR